MIIEPAVRAFVERQRVARLATVDGHGHPHVVPVTFALVADVLYTSIDEKPKRTMRLQRVRNIEAHPRVTVLVDVYDENWSRLAWAQLRGEAAVLDDGPEHARGVAALQARYPQYASMHLASRPMIRVAVERVVAWGALG